VEEKHGEEEERKQGHFAVLFSVHPHLQCCSSLHCYYCNFQLVSCYSFISFPSAARGPFCLSIYKPTFNNYFFPRGTMPNQHLVWLEK